MLKDRKDKKAQTPASPKMSWEPLTSERILEGMSRKIRVKKSILGVGALLCAVEGLIFKMFFFLPFFLALGVGLLYYSIRERREAKLLHADSYYIVMKTVLKISIIHDIDIADSINVTFTDGVEIIAANKECFDLVEGESCYVVCAEPTGKAMLAFGRQHWLLSEDLTSRLRDDSADTE